MKMDGTNGWAPILNVLKGETAALQADMNAFLYLYVYQMESVAVKAIRSYDKNHMIFAPSAIGGMADIGMRPQVLQALADAEVDALAISYSPRVPQNVSIITQAYDLTGKPTITWYGVSGEPGFLLSRLSELGADYPTQETRADALQQRPERTVPRRGHQR